MIHGRIVGYVYIYIYIHKVAAHGRCKNQNPDLSEGNRKADELAKACADQLFIDQLDDLTS